MKKRLPVSRIVRYDQEKTWKEREERKGFDPKGMIYVNFAAIWRFFKKWKKKFDSKEKED